MKLIEVTTDKGEVISLNPRYIVMMVPATSQPGEDMPARTRIVLAGAKAGPLRVAETIPEITAKIGQADEM